MLNICFTFDYELFFGENFFTEKEILFEPTRKILKLLKDENISSTFFADVFSAIMYKKMNLQSFVFDFEQQLCDLYSGGQDVQLHIHPNWLNSIYEDGKWKFDKDSYRIHSFGFDKTKKNNAYQIINEGTDYLNTLLRNIDSNYKCIAYRAGGFAIQPHQELVKALLQNDIRIDSSIAMGLYSNNTTNYYDFRSNVNRINWRLSADKSWYEDGDKNSEFLLEIPIGTENKNPFLFLINRLLWPNKIKLSKSEKKGSYINEMDKKLAFSYWNYISGYNAMSLDSYTSDYLYYQLKRYYKKHHCDKNGGTVALISHPKLSDEKSILNMQKLILLLKNDKRFNICNIREAYMLTSSNFTP